MPVFLITSPDGKKYKVTAPEGATKEESLQKVMESTGENPNIKVAPGGVVTMPTPELQAVWDREIVGKEQHPVKNAFLGFAARGNQAMNALNPFASEVDNQKIAAEQEWVKQNSGAGIGSMIADAMITSPAGGLASLPARAIGGGLIEGSTIPGDAFERYKNATVATAGGALGEGVASALGFIAKPFKTVPDATSDKLRQAAKRIGLTLNAAQQTGNKTLQYMDSALDYIPSSSSSQQAFKQNQRDVWQEALFKQGGQDANAPTQDVMGDMKARISGVYNDVASRNSIVVDQDFKDALNVVKHELIGRIPVNQKSIVKSYLRDFDTAPIGAQIPGAQYQEIRSMLDKQARAFKNSDPATHAALNKIRDAADKAMERSVTPADAAAWKKANNDWAVMRSIENATDPTNATVSAPTLINTLKQRDSNRVIYGMGDQNLNDIAKIGKKFIAQSVPDSGTAQRAAMIKLLTGASALGAGSDLAVTHDPTSALAAGGVSMLSAILLPKLAAKMMQNPNGYLSKGLIDMSNETIPGVTRQRLLSELLRNAGTQTANTIGQQ